MVGIGPFVAHHETPFGKRSGRNRETDLISAQPDPDLKTGCSASGDHSVKVNH